MIVKNCMTHSVQLADPEMSIAEAAQKMRDGEFGSLPVALNDRLIGVVTDRDIAIRAVANEREPHSTKVAEVMSHHVLYCFEDDALDTVTQNMADNQVRRLPVLNREKRLVGIVSLGDIAESREVQRESGEALSRISSASVKDARYRLTA